MSSRKQAKEKKAKIDDVQEEAPPQRFDGVHTGAWVQALPASWIPYVQLCRLSPPVPLLLIFFPHCFGLLHAAITSDIETSSLTTVTAILFGGSFFVSNAIHVWNDLVDAPIDAQIPRTRNRPIPRGAVTPRAAFIFTLTQAALSAAFLLPLPEQVVWYTVPAVLAHAYYPWSKRHTYFPQVVLGVALQWPIVVASSATGALDVYADPSLMCLFVASVLWTVAYDTVYGYQDYKEDIRLGVGSTAVLFGSYGKSILWTMSNVIAGLLFATGYLAGMGPLYHVIAVGGSCVSLNVMMAQVNLLSPESCSWWFTYGFWGPAVSITGGLLAEFLFG